ncbi:MAG: phosphatidylinositol-specific phospholipase C/glycerophosphodiester phosphodiesterase family protein [Verrucomicrobiota bacterium]|nr:phosphatidylinositol-specific phospholipase C/glycerophosphodiester phosphodiesterase family protein [Verrucomicrobiota bacterium]
MKNIFHLFLICFSWPVLAAETQPQPRAHAHNDYEHSRPLFNALEHGFCSIEADIYLVDEKLLVAHDREKVDPARTLQKLYLDPLRERAQTNGGRIFRHGPTEILLIDVKLSSEKIQHDEKKALAESEKTYAKLCQVLRNYSSLLTKFYPDKTETNAITVIVTGARPPSLLAEKGVRLAAYDGRVADLFSAKSKDFIPLISDNWTEFFRWDGSGTFPPDEKTRLNEMVTQAHRHGRKIRFWKTPDLRAFWEELRQAGVDLINADDLAGLEIFLKHKHDP